MVAKDALKYSWRFRTAAALRAAHIIALLIVSSSMARSSPGQARADDLTGAWELTMTRFGEDDIGRIILEQSGTRLTGKAFGLTIAGSVSGNKVEFTVSTDDKTVIGSFSATIAGDRLSGDAKLEGEEVKWTARRTPSRGSSSPTAHVFEPKAFHRYFSGTIPPVLKIFPRDTVRTETVDAGGVDKTGKHRSPGGNPLTGPFYVEGAIQGDTLVVHFNRIRLNRDTAQSGSSIVGSALDPYYFQEKKAVQGFDSNWKLDRERGVARLAKPTDKLKNFTVALAPMLGCVGVAPPSKQSIRSGDLGPYGGNMDYNQIREGTTLYLPVFQQGALLYVGDGHAAQGDGELTGDALETSMDVEFSVDLIQGKSIGGPRAENEEYITAIGIGNSLPEGLQQATTELARWLEEDYKLNPSEVAVVLGFAIHYDIAEIVDSHINVAAKIKKSSLAQLQPDKK
jgi:amidase